MTDNPAGLRLIRVPPPKTMPDRDLICEGLGIPNHLKTKTELSFRCSQCWDYKVKQMMVYVPDGLRITDSIEAANELIRLNQKNGHFTGWCLPCAQNIGKPQKKIVDIITSVKQDSAPDPIFLVLILAVILFLFLPIIARFTS